MDTNTSKSDRVRAASARSARSKKPEASAQQESGKDKRKRGDGESAVEAAEEKKEVKGKSPRRSKKEATTATTTSSSATSSPQSVKKGKAAKSSSSSPKAAAKSPKAEKTKAVKRKKKVSKPAAPKQEEEVEEDEEEDEEYPDSEEEEITPAEKKARREAFDYFDMEEDEYISEEEGGDVTEDYGHLFGGIPWGHRGEGEDEDEEGAVLEEDEEEEEGEELPHHAQAHHPFGGAGLADALAGGASGSGDPFSDLLARLGSRVNASDRSGLLAGLLGQHGLMGGGSGGKYRILLEKLRGYDPHEQQMALEELTQILLMGNEDTLQGFRPEHFVPVLQQLLDVEHNPQVPIMACRALANMLEAIPTSSPVVASCAKPLCEKLLCIEYIDLAEQCLTTLNKLSLEQGRAVLQAGGLSAVLAYMDFFSLSLQRSAVVTASNACKYACVEEFPRIQDAIPILSSLLDPSRDKAMMESACLCISRLVQGLSAHADKLKLLCTHKVLENSLKLLETQPCVLSPNTFTMVLEYLVTICKQCPAVSVNLLQENVGRAIRTMILGSQAASRPREGRQAAGSGLSLELQPKQLRAVVRLAGQVLPPIPSDLAFARLGDAMVSSLESGAIVWEWQQDDGVAWRAYTPQQSQSLEDARTAGQDIALLSDDNGNRWIIKLDRMEQINPSSRNIRRIRRTERSAAAAKALKLDAAACAADPRATFFRINPSALDTLYKELLGVMFDAYLSTANPESRHAMMEWFVRLVYYSTPELLKEQLLDISISSYLAGMLSVDDPLVVMGALELVRLLVEKLPEIFHHHFRRQGVVHHILALAKGAKGKARASEAGDSVEASPSSTKGAARPSSRSSKGKKAAAAAAAAEEDAGAPAPTADKLSATEAAATLTREAHALFTAHFGKVEEGDSDAHEAYASLHKLHKLAEQLNACWRPAAVSGAAAMDLAEDKKGAAGMMPTVPSSSAALEEDTKVLTQVFECLADAASAPSSFELMESGMVLALLNYLTVPNDQAATKRMKRIRAFAKVFVGDVQNEEFVVSGKGPSVLASLVANLHGSLNTVERFPTRETEARTNVGAELNTAIKLCLELDPQSKGSLKEFGAPVVLIEPMASIQAIEDFLWPRVRMSPEERRAAKAIAKAKATASATKAKARGRRGKAQAEPMEEGRDGAKGAAALQGDEEEEEEEEEDEEEEEEEEEEHGQQQRRGHEVHELHLPAAGAAGAGAGAGAEIGSSDNLLLQSRRSQRCRLTISLEGHDLLSNTTIFQAIKMYAAKETKKDAKTAPKGHLAFLEHLGGRGGAGEVYKLKYRAYSDERAEASASASANASMMLDTTVNDGGVDRLRSNQSFLFDGSVATHPLEKYMLLPSSSKLPESDPTYPVLCLLRALHGLSEHVALLDQGAVCRAAEVIPETHFANQMLSSKIMRQVSDFDAVCRGTFPAWCRQVMTACPFLVPLEQRLRYFYYSEVGPIRALQRYKAEHDAGGAGDAGGGGSQQDRFKLSKTKVRISRERILESAVHVMKAYAGAKSQLEIEYFGEVGTGLGPTLEFYALTSRAFQERHLGIWRETTRPGAADGAAAAAAAAGTGTDAVAPVPRAEYVYSPLGLFPAPVPGELPATKRRVFETLGRFVAKAILDCRIVDLPFSSVFFAWLLGTEDQLGVSDLRDVDVALWQSTSRLALLARRKAKLDAAAHMSAEEKERAAGELLLDGARVEDLCLDFTLPGYPEVELVPGGKDKAVTLENLGEYVDRIVQVTLVEGVRQQLEAFKDGFSGVVGLESLRLFDVVELDQLLCGAVAQAWTYEDLADAILTDHGYNRDSRAVHWLLKILSTFDRHQQRDFVAFLTGSPNLPVGGFKSLKPHLTIVRKDTESGVSADQVLPSVMTCQNYLKLPDYSSLDVMRAKILLAMSEGQASFHLS